MPAGGEFVPVELQGDDFVVGGLEHGPESHSSGSPQPGLDPEDQRLVEAGDQLVPTGLVGPAE